jgi:hypothetical protein
MNAPDIADPAVAQAYDEIVTRAKRDVVTGSAKSIMETCAIMLAEERTREASEVVTEPHGSRGEFERDYGKASAWILIALAGSHILLGTIAGLLAPQQARA